MIDVTDALVGDLLVLSSFSATDGLDHPQVTTFEKYQFNIILRQTVLNNITLR